jgi:hypothetical protein
MRFRWQDAVRGFCGAAVLLAIAGAAAGCPGARQVSKAEDDPVCAEVKRLQGPARQEVLAIARLLAIRPAMAIDFSDASGEYCLNTGSHVMAHFTTRPNDTSEDIVYFVDAEPLIARGLRFEDFPALGTDQGTMQPNTLYRYEGKGNEPHHMREMADKKWLVLAVDVK